MTIQSLHSFKYENSKIIFPFPGKWIMLLFSLVAIACTNEKTLNEKINTLYSTPIVFPESGILRVDGSSIVPYQEKLSESRYNMVVFHSQTECTVCALEKMSDWNALLNWERKRKSNEGHHCPPIALMSCVRASTSWHLALTRLALHCCHVVCVSK